MKLAIVRSTENKVEQAERLLNRELTPDERRWLMLADQLLESPSLNEGHIDAA